MTKIPNNPAQAYLMGKRHGRQENFDVVAMALLDKCGFRVIGEAEDHQTLEYLYKQVDYYIDEINAGNITKASIKEMLAGDYKVAFRDNGSEGKYENRAD